MPPKRIRRLREKVQKKTRKEEAKAVDIERKKAQKKVRRRERVNTALAPVREAKGLAGDVKDLTKAKASKINQRIPGSSSTQRTSSPQQEEMTEREEKILLAQRFRNEGLTTKQVASRVGMSPSWVSSNTVAVDASRTLEAGDDLEQSADGFLEAMQSTESAIFDSEEDSGQGMLEGGVDIDLSDLDRDLDKGLGGIDDQFGDID